LRIGRALCRPDADKNLHAGQYQDVVADPDADAGCHQVAVADPVEDADTNALGNPFADANCIADCVAICFKVFVPKLLGLPVVFPDRVTVAIGVSVRLVFAIHVAGPFAFADPLRFSLAFKLKDSKQGLLALPNAIANIVADEVLVTVVVAGLYPIGDAFRNGHSVPNADANTDYEQVANGHAYAKSVERTA
jgi:hypothetical protein